MSARILICVVVFNQHLEKTNSYKTLLNGSKDVVVIDNSTEDISNNRELSQNNKWEYIRYPNNPGLSFAYNTAAAYAKENGYDWMMLSDQDTYFKHEIIDNYKNLCNSIKDVYLFCPRVIVPNEGLLSPVKLNHYFPKISKTILRGNTIINPHNYAIINSGLLINIDAYYKVGGYNNKVFLDFSDFQFIEKFGKYYDKVYVSEDKCLQSFSNQIENLDIKLKRFKLFCKSLKHFKCNHDINRILLHLVVIKRALALSLHYKTIIPFNILLKNYIQ